MKFKKVLAGACTSAMVFSMFTVPVLADTSTGTNSIIVGSEYTENGSTSWIEETYSISDLIGDSDVDVDTLSSITFTYTENPSSWWANSFTIGYTSSSTEEWIQDQGNTSVTLDSAALSDVNEDGIKVGLSSDMYFTLNVEYTYEVETPVVADPDEEETVAVDLSGAGQTRAEGGVYRLNLYNPWTGDSNDMIIDPAATANASKLIVTFKVEGLGDKSGKIGINFSANGWANQYWFDEPENIVAENVEVTEDGTYTVSVATADGSALGVLDFADIQTDIDVDEGDVDLEVTSGFTLSAVSVEIVEAAAPEETPNEETPDEETPSEETPSEETPSEETPDVDPSNNGTPSETPETGDVAPVAALAVVAVAALGVAAVSFKKRENA